MDQDDMYDEFGNYIGPEILSDSESEGAQEHKEQEVPEGVQQVLNVSNEHQIVLHQDKKFYVSHEQLYPGAEIMMEQEDRQAIDVPLVSTEHERCYDHEEPIQTYYQSQYMLDLLPQQSGIRNVCVAGHFHHGKTLLMDILVQHTHVRKPTWNL